jgi:enoyl-CoA hydratase/carnithine racemase
MESRVTIECRDGVADVRLARAGRMNALDDEMFSALLDAGERLKKESGVRAIVLSGEGRAFCAGLDVERFQAIGSGNAGDPHNRLSVGDFESERFENGANRFQQAVMIWREIPAPVIAAIHGVAFGAGLQLALGCDMRFVTSDARMALLEIKWGLVPDLGGIALLRGLVRDDVARDLTWSGRIFSGSEAVAVGIGTRVCDDPRQDALAFAIEIAQKSPHAIQAGKRLLNLAARSDLSTFLVEESREQAALLGAHNQIEAVRANLEQRPPVFQDV